MSKTIALLAAAGLAVAAMSPVSAAPMAPLASTGSDMAVLVAGGCGPGWHRGPYGGCLRNYARPWAHACPRGYHIGPGGACRGNGR